MPEKVVRDPVTGDTYWGDTALPTDRDALEKFSKHHKAPLTPLKHITHYPGPEKKAP